MVVHGVVGRHMQQVRAGHGHLEHQLDVIQMMEQRQCMYSIKIRCEIHQQAIMIV